MTLARAIRRLQRRPVFVLIALLCAGAVGGLLFKSTSRVGIASASALVDSSKSQVADLGDSSGASVGTLAYRASLLASLIANSPIKDQIARAGGLPSSALTATGPSTVVGTGGAASAAPSAPAASPAPNASTLSASVPTLPAGQLPVIQVSTQAPTPALAAKLANAAFAALTAEINSVAGTNNISIPQRLVIRPLGPAASGWSTQGPGTMLAALGALIAFIAACAALLWLSSLRAALREEATREHEMTSPESPVGEAPTQRAPVLPADEAPEEQWTSQTEPRGRSATAAPTSALEHNTPTPIVTPTPPPHIARMWHRPDDRQSAGSAS